MHCWKSKPNRLRQWPGVKENLQGATNGVVIVADTGLRGQAKT